MFFLKIVNTFSKNKIYILQLFKESKQYFDCFHTKISMPFLS